MYRYTFDNSDTVPAALPLWWDILCNNLQTIPHLEVEEELAAVLCQCNSMVFLRIPVAITEIYAHMAVGQFLQRPRN